MRKEVVFAIIFGLILGGVIIFGIQIANKTTQKAASTSPSPTPLVNNQTITPTPEELPLVITSPLNNSVVNLPTVTITGKTFKNGLIAATTNDNEILAKANEDGSFSFDFPLVGGDNQIKIEAKSTEDKPATINLLIIYTTAKI
jgi:hypothetical protein